MKYIIMSILMTVLAFGTACGQAPEPEPAASDGIQVHGHWTVTVTNPDGTLASVQEFSNELEPISDTRGNGPALMTALLAGETSIDPTAWQIALYANHNINCQENPYFNPQSNWYNNVGLSATAVRDPTPGSPLRISTTCTLVLENPATPTQIKMVITRALPTTSFESYGNTDVYTTQTISAHNITIKEFQTADQVDIQHNQVIGFNVVISFS
jgi:hypothetical protein